MQKSHRNSVQCDAHGIATIITAHRDTHTHHHIFRYTINDNRYVERI